MRANPRIVLTIACLTVAASAGAQQEKLRQPSTTKADQPLGGWSASASKAPDGTPIHTFSVRGSPGIGAQWATMRLVRRGDQWTSATVGSDRQVGPKGASVKVLLIADGARSAANCTTPDGQTLSFDAPEDLADTLFKSSTINVGFLPPGAVNAVGLEFNARGFRDTVAKNPPAAAAQPASQPAAADAAALQAAIEQALGKSYRNVKKVWEVQATGKTLKVRFSIGDNLTANMIKGSAMTDVQRVLKAVQSAGHPYTEITVVGTFPLKDTFGNSTESEVVRATYRRATVDRINWDGFDKNNIYKIADNIWLDPSFQ